MGLGIACFINSGLGCDPIALLCDGLSAALSKSFGTAAFIYNLTMIILALLLARSFLGGGTIVYGLLSGVAIDLNCLLFERLSIVARGLPARVVLFCTGEILMSLSFAALMQLELSMTALDALLTLLSKKTRAPYAVLKMINDAVFVVTGILLGGTFGVVTLISVAVTGMLVAKIGSFIKKCPKKDRKENRMKRYKRVFVVVLDSLGVGAMPDSLQYGDVDVDTFGHIAETVRGFAISNLVSFGMANLHPIPQYAPIEKPLGRFTKLSETSYSKDTMTGHWEMMGLHTKTPFKTFTDTGFPPELIAELEKRCGKRVIGNRSASGTEIIDELGEEEINTGAMIVYTSADSVLQICGQEETFDLQNLYRCCEIARELTMRDEWKVGRVIARPYVGMKKGEFKRTSNRHDYALKPFGKTALDVLKDSGLDVISVGKIYDIFAGEGLTESNHSESSVHGMEQTVEIAQRDFRGLCFTNLVDFDALWGHRRDPHGYAREIEKFDIRLGRLMEALREDDLLILTADHGNDPTYTKTDHTREKVPFIAWLPSMEGSGSLPEQETFAVIGATVVDNFGLPMLENTIGISLLKHLS